MGKFGPKIKTEQFAYVKFNFFRFRPEILLLGKFGAKFGFAVPTKLSLNLVPTIIHKIFEKKPSSHVKQQNTGKFYF